MGLPIFIYLSGFPSLLFMCLYISAAASVIFIFLYVLLLHNVRILFSQRWNIVNNGMWAGCVITGEVTMYSNYSYSLCN